MTDLGRRIHTASECGRVDWPHIHIQPENGFAVLTHVEADGPVDLVITDYGWRRWFKRPLDIIEPVAVKWLGQIDEA